MNAICTSPAVPTVILAEKNPISKKKMPWQHITHLTHETKEAFQA